MTTEKASILFVFATFRCYQFDTGILTQVDRRLREHLDSALDYRPKAGAATEVVESVAQER